MHCELSMKPEPVGMQLHGPTMSCSSMDCARFGFLSPSMLSYHAYKDC